MSALLSTTPDRGAMSFPPVEFGRSAEGFPVARVGEVAFAMLPGREGHYFLATGRRITRPLAEWRRSDFFGHDGELADEAAFRARISENAEHQRERRALGRREIQSRAHTPWGPSQGTTIYAEGIVSHSTASHGGFHLTVERNAQVHPMLRVDGGFYEEDAAWAIVAITYPQHFTSFERRCAEKTVKDSWPDAWELIFGRSLAPGESHEKDRRAFDAAHAEDWIVTSAISSGREKRFVECVATRGGMRREGVEERRFLVPCDEYAVGRFGFVIDTARHRAYDGPSDFIGWQRKAGP